MKASKERRRNPVRVALFHRFEGAELQMRDRRLRRPADRRNSWQEDHFDEGENDLREFED